MLNSTTTTDFTTAVFDYTPVKNYTSFEEALKDRYEATDSCRSPLKARSKHVSCCCLYILLLQSTEKDVPRKTPTPLKPTISRDIFARRADSSRKIILLSVDAGYIDMGLNILETSLRKLGRNTHCVASRQMIVPFIHKENDLSLSGKEGDLCREILTRNHRVSPALRLIH